MYPPLEIGNWEHSFLFFGEQIFDGRHPMGKYKPFILLGAAVVVALITSVLIYSWLQRKAKVEKTEAFQTQSVAVAAADLSWGTVLTKGMTKVVPFLKASLPEGYFSDPASLEGRVLLSPIKANEPIFETKLAPTNVKTGGVAAVITPKKRAIAIRVDKTIGVSGFIHPGNRVDVLVTMATGKTPAPLTKTVLENILVLAAGTETETKGKEEKPSNVDVITIEVTPEEAEKVALAATEGRLQLVLRNFSDTEDVITKGTDIPALLASYSYGPVKETKADTRRAPVRKVVETKRPVVTPAPTPAPTPAIEKPPEKASFFTVELIKGTKASEVKFEGRE
jgi:pilus assembly protein CpaB